MIPKVTIQRTVRAGMNEVVRRDKLLREMDKLRVRVGFPKGGATYENGMTLASVAVIQEFGSTENKIPARPFIRNTAKENKAKYAKLGRVFARKVMRGDKTPKAALSLIGLEAAKDIIKKIQSIWTPANKPSTIAKKTRAGKIGDKPLVDTGKLKQSVSYALEGETPKVVKS